ncbi:MAG: hypothetical protein ACYTBJ_18750 [Planctomycetota bacterium]
MPDSIVSSASTVIFVHGCFWHNHSNCNRAKPPKTNKAFWKRKIQSNKRRDRRIARSLRQQGWHVFTVWECRLPGGANNSPDEGSVCLVEMFERKGVRGDRNG